MVVIDQNTWVLSSILKAMDVLIKLVFIMDLQFQTLVTEFWDFISGMVLCLPYNGPNDSLLNKLRDMGQVQKTKDDAKKGKKAAAAAAKNIAATNETVPLANETVPLAKETVPLAIAENAEVETES